LTNTLYLNCYIRTTNDLYVFGLFYKQWFEDNFKIGNLKKIKNYLLFLPHTIYSKLFEVEKFHSCRIQMYFAGKHLQLALLELLIFKFRLLQLESKVLLSNWAEITNQQLNQQYHSSSVSHDFACHLTCILARPQAQL